MREQVRNRDRQVVIRIQQPSAARHDAVAIVIGIAGPSEVEAVFQFDQTAMAYGEEQSMRILPSQSTRMKRKVGSA